MLAKIDDVHRCEVGPEEYWFRTPNGYDPAKLRRRLTLEGVRRPALNEFRVAGLAGIAALAEQAGDVDEGLRQQQVYEEWYRLLTPLSEDNIDEPDLDKRATLFEAAKEKRAKEIAETLPEANAIEAVLARHWPPYRELLADRHYWDEISNIEVVRLLLARKGNAVLPRDSDGLVSEEAYMLLPRADLPTLSAFAFALLSPSEAQRKN